MFVPVKVHSATQDRGVHFHEVHSAVALVEAPAADRKPDRYEDEYR
jgi:non-homologous end joining protein Ku